MADLAALGLAVDTSQIDAASKSLGNFVSSGKNAQLSADVLAATAIRLGISIAEVQRRLAAANDNMSASAAQAMKLADATKQVTAANDNLSGSLKNTNAAVSETGQGFFSAAEHALTLVGHLKLLALGAYALFPSFRGVVNAGLGKAMLEIIPAAGLAARAIGGLVTVLSPAISFFARIGVPILAAVAAFELIHSVWNKGSALLDKYANSLRSLYSEDVVQNLNKLTKNQGEAGDLISAEQIARATELGVRLQNASFIIDRYMKTSLIDLTNVSLKLQSVWVNIVEVVAKVAQSMAALPMDKLANAISKINPAFGVVKSALSGGPEENSDASLQSATGRLSAIMGVAALASEALNKTKMAVGDLDHELDIGGSFVARYSDAIKKLADGARETDTWDRMTRSISRGTSALIANSESVGQTISFQEQLRVETRLLESTKGGLNAATDDQIAKFAELRSTMEVENALQEAGIKLDKERTQTMVELAKAAGEARQQRAQEISAIANQKALDADVIALRSLTAYSATQKGVIASDQIRLQLERDLREGRMTQAQVDERAASAGKVARETELKQLSEAARARALNVTQAAQSAQVSIDAIGKSVGENYRLLTIEQTRQQLEQDASARHTTINQKELADLTEKINKTAQLKQLEAEASAQSNANFERQTLLLSDVERHIASIQRQLHGDNWKEFMNDGLSNSIRLNSALKDLKDSFDDVGKSIFSAFLSGKSAMDAMVQSLDNLAKKLADRAFSNILEGVLSGNAVQAGIGVAQAGASALISLFTGDQKAKKQREEAEAAWKKMASQVEDFNRAAAGFDLGPLTNELRSMMSTFESLRRAADEAGDAAGAARLNEAFMAGTRRIVDEFKAGAQELSPLQAAIKEINDEFRGLTETLTSLNYGSLTIGLDEAAAAQIRKIIKKYTDQLNDSLEERLNIASGRSFINDANALMKRRQSDLALAAELGNDPATISKITAVFHLEAQKIVNDSGLVGDAFDEFIRQFPDLAGVVVQANEDMTASAKQLADQMNASARTIVDFVNGLYAGPNSTLSPQAQLAAAQQTYNTKLGLAQAGDASAQSSITGDAQRLLDAARTVYASSAGYQSIFQNVANQLLGLPSVQQTTDPTVIAMRDVLTAINLGNSTQATNATLALVNTNTVATASATQNTANQAAAIANLQTTSNSLQTTANSLVTSSNAFLTAINSFADRIIQAINSQGTLMASVGNETNLRLGVLLNWQPLIVYGQNTAPGNYGGTGFSYAPKAMGGWIEGGIPGRDSVPLASGTAIGMPGEFVIRNAVAQANASWLPSFNRTGQLPANDNAGIIAELRMLRASNEMMQRQIAQMVYDAGEKSASATRSSGEDLRAEMRMRKRDQRTA